MSTLPPSKRYVLDTPSNKPDSGVRTDLDKIRVHPFCQMHGAMDPSRTWEGVYECPKCGNQIVFQEITV